jgi:hypothetical protein
MLTLRLCHRGASVNHADIPSNMEFCNRDVWTSLDQHRMYWSKYAVLSCLSRTSTIDTTPAELTAAATSNAPVDQHHWSISVFAGVSRVENLSLYGLRQRFLVTQVKYWSIKQHCNTIVKEWIYYNLFLAMCSVIIGSDINPILFGQCVCECSSSNHWLMY